LGLGLGLGLVGGWGRGGVRVRVRYDLRLLKQPSRQATKTKAKRAGVIHSGTCMWPLKSVHMMGGSSNTGSSAPSAVGSAGWGRVRSSSKL